MSELRGTCHQLTHTLVQGRITPLLIYLAQLLKFHVIEIFLLLLWMIASTLCLILAHDTIFSCVVIVIDCPIHHQIILLAFIVIQLHFLTDISHFLFFIHINKGSKYCR